MMTMLSIIWSLAVVVLAILGVVLILLALAALERRRRPAPPDPGFNRRVADAIASGEADAAIARALRRNSERNEPGPVR